MFTRDKALGLDDQPVIPAALAGFRIFRISHRTEPSGEVQLSLSSAYQKANWEPGINRAVCLPIADLLGSKVCDSSPGDGCRCGLQAYYRFDPDVVIDPGFFEHQAIASVAGGGQTMMHAQGWRAEKAQVTALFMPDYSGLIEEEDFDQLLLRQKELADRYQVPLFLDYQKWIDYVEDKTTTIARKDPLPPRRRWLRRYSFGPLDLNDEIALNGGDCSLKITSLLHYPNYKPGDFPLSVLKRRSSLFLTIFWSLRSFSKKMNLDFLENSVEFIKNQGSKTLLNLTSFFDSAFQYGPPLLIVVGASIFLDSADGLLRSLAIPLTITLFISLMIILRSIRKRLRKRLIAIINREIKLG